VFRSLCALFSTLVLGLWALHVLGLLQLGTSNLMVKPRAEEGVAYIANIDELTLEPGSTRASRFRLLENGHELGPKNSLHQEVRRRGSGRYSVWGKWLLFSAADNSDPRTNGRIYVLEGPIAAPLWIPALLTLLLLWGARLFRPSTAIAVIKCVSIASFAIAVCVVAWSLIGYRMTLSIEASDVEPRQEHAY